MADTTENNNCAPEKANNNNNNPFGDVPIMELVYNHNIQLDNLFMSRMHNENKNEVNKESVNNTGQGQERRVRRTSSGIQSTPFRHNFNHLNPDLQQFVDSSSENTSGKNIGFFSLYRFATWGEWCMLWLSLFLSAIMGTLIPIGNIVYGEFTSLLVDRTTANPNSSATIILNLFGGGKIIPNGTQEEYMDALRDDSVAYGLSGLVITTMQLTVGLIGISLLNYVALKQIKRIRLLFLSAVLRQDIAWFDTNTDMNFATKVSEDLDKLRDGIGEKLGIFVFLLFSFVSAIIVSFFYGWKLTLVVISSTPILVLATAIVAKVQSSISVKELKAYSAAGSVAEEVLGAIRTVIAFGGEQKEVERYSEKLAPAKRMAARKGLFSGLGSCFMWIVTYVSYAVSFYYGVVLILDDSDIEDKVYTPATLLIIFFGILIGAQNMGLTAPHMEAFNSARASASSIFSIMERVPSIDSLSKTKGIIPSSLNGDICFERVHFHYPSRPSVKILRGINLTIKCGKMVAIVGPSGCGKSTTLQLIQRLYDPLEGKVTINGIDLKDLNVRHLRSQISVVGQEPVLFTGSIAENIRYGRPDCTDQEIEIAAKAADCHDFITKLPEGYDTEVGERGAQLSGGQKQRICVARALIRQPSILLLDEATSALDAKAQAKMLRNIAIAATAANITVINVTHRLSAISNADYIIYMDSGSIMESGTHSELMKEKGLYYKLISEDMKAQVEQDVTADENEDYLRKASNIVKMKKTLQDTEESGSFSADSAEDISLPTSSFIRILKLNSKEWVYVLMGSIASIMLGATYPAFAIIFGNIFGLFALDDRAEILDKTFDYCIWYLAIGSVTGVLTFVQIYLFSISGSCLTARIRTMTFSTMMKQEMGWYDKPEHSVGALNARLAGDCGAVQGASGTRIGSLLQAGSTLLLGIVLSLFFSWKMTAISIVVVPTILVGVIFEGRSMAQSAVAEKLALENATKIATEAISNIRTVASLGQEEGFMERYKAEVIKLHNTVRSKTKYRGVIFSFGQSIPFYGYALTLYYGGLLVANGEIDYPDAIKVSEALIFGSWMLGQALSFTPNFNAAKISASRLFELFDRKSKIASSSCCKNMENWKSKGAVDYDDIHFSYPNRPDMTILKGLNLHIDAGATVALVGQSGCGKSTCIQLLQRFYDPPVGNVTLDDEDIADDLSLETLRSQLGIVSQEPVLFDRTIGQNIAYGDNTRAVTEQEIIQAAKEANIHEFIMSLPLAYDTSLGRKGAQLSGGQKQRIAIARALVRNPRVLLLDEATSALDTHSEKLVQEALDHAGQGRTCIIIAHRLSSVRRADMICVIDKGRVVESGTHEQLLFKKGLYSQMYKSQLTNL